MSKPYPIGYHTTPMREGRHCLVGDLDKGVLTQRLEYLAIQYAHKTVTPTEWGTLFTALLVIGHHLGSTSESMTFPISLPILERYGISMEDLKPAIAELERANLFSCECFRDDGRPMGRFLAKAFDATDRFETEICRPGNQARGIPDGTLAVAMTMIVFGNEEGRVFNCYTPFVNSRHNENELFMTLDFVIVEGEYAGQYVSRDIPLGTRAAWDADELPEPAEYRQIANSAFNVFSFDDSEAANELRDAMKVNFNDAHLSLQEKVVVIEIGLATDGSGINYLKSIVQPEHPRYIEVMDLGAGISAGTGVFGEYVPSAEPSSIGDP